MYTIKVDKFYFESHPQSLPLHRFFFSGKIGPFSASIQFDRK